MSNCNCPLPAELADIPVVSCPFKLDQLSRFIITRSASTTFPLTVGATPADDPTLQAFWDGLTTGDDKIVKTPIIGGDPVISGGEPQIEGGGDNSTFNGKPEYNGNNSSQFTGVFKNLSPAAERAMKDLSCEELQVFFISNTGKIFGLSKDAGVTFYGIPVSALALGDRNNEGFNSKDTNQFSFSLDPRWSDYLHEITPEAAFNPLTF